MRNERKTLGKYAGETRTSEWKERERERRRGTGESWLALVFEFKYQSVGESEASGLQEPLQPENPRDSDTVFARN